MIDLQNACLFIGRINGWITLLLGSAIVYASFKVGRLMWNIRQSKQQKQMLDCLLRIESLLKTKNKRQSLSKGGWK